MVAEIVSKDRRRDLVEKRRDYARAGISEYWIIDQEKERVIVLTLKAGRYQVFRECGMDGNAESRILKGFAIDASELLA